MIIAISGSVGTGKTTIAKNLGEKLRYRVVHLNEFAKEFKLEEVKELQTFDFDIDRLVSKVNRDIADNLYGRDIIFEGHFAHFLNPDLIDFLIVINRDLKELKVEYKKRDYNEKKIKDNLEVESFNLCFYEGEEEGYKEGQIICIENNKSIDEIVEKIIKKVKK